MSDAPAWLRAILYAERTIAAPLNRAVNSDEAATMLLLVARAGRHGRELAERGRASVVHALSLPSHRDVQRLEAKIEHLRRAVEERAAQDESPPS